MKWLTPAIAIVIGWFVLVGTFFTLQPFPNIATAFKQWAIILTGFALLLGVLNLFQVHVKRLVRRNEPGLLYSLVLLITATLTILVGLYSLGSSDLSGSPIGWVFQNMYVPLQASFFALVAFFLATAAYRALRARSWETFLMLLAALIVFLGQIPLLVISTQDPSSPGIMGGLTQLRLWILNVPSTAGVRGIMLGVALGTIATGLRLLVGLDRPYSE